MVFLRYRTARVSTFALIHGGWSAGTGTVVEELQERGHDPVVVDLPTEDPAAGWWDYADTVVEAVGDRRTNLVVVGHSLGAFTAPLAARDPGRPARAGRRDDPGAGGVLHGLVEERRLRGERVRDVFYHDVPPELAAEAQRRGARPGDKPLEEPWPLEAWPDVPTRYLLCRDDRMFRPSGRDGTPGSASASRPTRWTAGTTSCSASRASSRSGSSPTYRARRNSPKAARAGSGLRRPSPMRNRSAGMSASAEAKMPAGRSTTPASSRSARQKASTPSSPR